MTEPIKISDMVHMERITLLEPILAAQPIDQRIIDEVFAMLGESPEALRGLLFGLSLADSVGHLAVLAILRGKLSTLKVFLMRDPRGRAAYELLEGTASRVQEDI